MYSEVSDTVRKQVSIFKIKTFSCAWEKTGEVSRLADWITAKTSYQNCMLNMQRTCDKKLRNTLACIRQTVHSSIFTAQNTTTSNQENRDKNWMITWYLPGSSAYWFEHNQCFVFSFCVFIVNSNVVQYIRILVIKRKPVLGNTIGNN